MDKETYWWKKLTNYELQLSRMSLADLAKELNRTKVKNEVENTIIIEHILAARLAKIQARASWWSGWLSFAGAMLATALTFYLGQLSVTTNDNAKVIPTTGNKAQEYAIKKPVPPIVPSIEQSFSKNKTIESHKKNGNDK